MDRDPRCQDWDSIVQAVKGKMAGSVLRAPSTANSVSASPFRSPNSKEIDNN